MDTWPFCFQVKQPAIPESFASLLLCFLVKQQCSQINWVNLGTLWVFPLPSFQKQKLPSRDRNYLVWKKVHYNCIFSGKDRRKLGKEVSYLINFLSDCNFFILLNYLSNATPQIKHGIVLKLLWRIYNFLGTMSPCPRVYIPMLFNKADLKQLKFGKRA